jgi:hypothetical protein
MGAEVAMHSMPGSIPAPGEKKVGVNPMLTDFLNQDAGVPFKNNSGGPLQNILTYGQLQLSGTYHVHPGGVWNYASNSYFAQEPSLYDLFATQNDKNMHGMTGLSYVLAAGSNTVYILMPSNSGANQAIEVATFPLDKFTTIK